MEITLDMIDILRIMQLISIITVIVFLIRFFMTSWDEDHKKDSRGAALIGVSLIATSIVIGTQIGIAAHPKRDVLSGMSPEWRSLCIQFYQASDTYVRKAIFEDFKRQSQQTKPSLTHAQFAEIIRQTVSAEYENASDELRNDLTKYVTNNNLLISDDSLDVKTNESN